MSFDFSGWTLVFDLDGTLIETAPDLHAALNHALAGDNLPPVSLDTVRMMIGDGAKAMIRKALDHHGVAIDERHIDKALWPAFLAHYRKNITHHSRPFDDCLTSLSELRTAGAKLAVCTNKSQALAEAVLAGLDMTQYFSAIVGGDTLATKKPDGEHIKETVRRSGGDPARAIMIGDAWTDERAARDAQLPFVFVSFGYGTHSNQPYDHLISIDHWRDMRQALSELAIQT